MMPRRVILETINGPIEVEITPDDWKRLNRGDSVDLDKYVKSQDDD